MASANCIVYCAGTPVFADIDPKTYNISPLALEQKMTRATRAVIPVHFAGQSCDMQAIHGIVRQKQKEYGHKIYIIEDASHALGSSYKAKKVGSGAFSDMTVLSFHPVKHITTAEGGMLTTPHGEQLDWLRTLSLQGLSRDAFTCIRDREEHGAVLFGNIELDGAARRALRIVVIRSDGSRWEKTFVSNLGYTFTIRVFEPER